MGERTWPSLLSALLRGEELASGETAWAMGEIVAGAATPAQIAAFAVALRAKGETPDEISGLVDAMLAAAVPVDLAAQGIAAGSVVDVVGTGGDRAHTVNVSTMAALVVAAAGVAVVKHGNRAASSRCGAADLLEELGLPLDLGPVEVAQCVAEAGIGFCFAPRFHAGLRHAAAARREIGIPTAFNFLGPLTNPARPRAGAVGCADPRMARLMAEVFARRADSVLVLHGQDGLDEFTTSAATHVWVVRDCAVTTHVIDACDLGLPRARPADLRGEDAAYNAAVARSVLSGEGGPIRDVVLLNAAAALVAHAGLSGAGSAAGPVDAGPTHEAAGSAARTPTTEQLRAALAAGLDRAAAAIDSGAAQAKLAQWLELGRTLAGRA